MARFEEKDFKKHISSKKLNNIYVIYGDEKYLVKFYTKELVKVTVGENPSEFSFHEFEGTLDLNMLSAAVGAVPFMTEYNCVLVRDFNISKLSKDDYDALISIVKSTPDSTVLIFTYPTKEQDDSKKSEGDSKGKKASFKSFLTAVDKVGIVAEINMRSATALEHQVASWADKMGKKISLPVASKMIFYCGTDLSALNLELHKLVAFSGDEEEITLPMVEKIVTKKLEAKIYELVDQVIFGNLDKAYKELHSLFTNREDPRDILRVLGLSYVDLYRARVTVESGGNMKETADFFKYGARAWVLSKAQKKSERLSTNALRESIGAIADLSEKLNSVSVNEEAALEKLIADLSIIAKRELQYA